MLSRSVKKIVDPVRLMMRCSASTTTGASQPVEATQFQPRMEKCINQVTLLGRVGANPQLRGSEEHPVTVFTIATHVNYKYQSGQVQQKTEWHRISVFKPFLRDSVYKYLSKGQRVLVQGKLMYGQITDGSGTVHTTATVVADEVVFFNKVQSPLEEGADEEVI